MKKLFLLSLLCLGLTVSSFADYLDDWPDDALCGWMENPLPPSYMVEEVKTRGISCSGGIPVPPEIEVLCLLEPCDPIALIVLQLELVGKFSRALTCGLLMKRILTGKPQKAL